MKGVLGHSGLDQCQCECTDHRIFSAEYLAREEFNAVIFESF